MQCILKHYPCTVSGIFVPSISLGNGNSICHLHYSSLYTLKLVTGTGKHKKKKKIDHGMNCRFRLTYSDSLNQDCIESGCFTKYYRLPCLPGNTSQSAG